MPIFCNVKNNDEFQFPPFYEEHNIRSTIDIVIKGKKIIMEFLKLTVKMPIHSMNTI